VVTHPTTNPPI